MLTNQKFPHPLPAFERNNVPVVLAANNLYAPYAGVFIQSLLDHAGEGNNYDIIILNRDISEENKRLLKSMAAGHINISIRFYDPSPLFTSFHYVDEEHNWPLEIFYKIAAPHFLNYSDRMIVSDVDTLLKTDIARLMDEDLEGCCVGGVTIAGAIYASCSLNRTLWSTNRGVKARDYWREYGFEDWENWESYKKHIVGSLLVYDCDKYVRDVDVETLLNTVQQDNGFWTEERVLYVLMKEKIKLLDPAWNVVPPANEKVAERQKIAMEIYGKIYNDPEVFKRAYENPFLLHWANRPKPWVCPDVPYGSEWWQTALRTPFVGHIIARMLDEQEKRRAYYRERYGKEVDIWEPSPKGIDRKIK